MPPTSYQEEFERKYEKPVLNGLVVGFSGIDPQKKGDCGCDPDELTDAQLAIVNEEIDKAIDELIILIDSGEIGSDYPTPPPTPTPTPTPTPILTNHEELEGLQGGQEGEHYHLTEAERDKVRDYPEYSTLAGNLPHENLDGLLGGNSSGHYHLTDGERRKVQEYPEYARLSENIEHENLDGLLGGNASGHYHLTEAERSKVRNYPDYENLSENVKHEELDGLLGGDASGHYHLTGSERTKLQSYPEYSNLVVNLAGDIDHEKLSNLLGGNDDGHYHMTESEKQKLSLYPSYSNLSQAVNHERVSGLQGGTTNEHFHLTEAELNKLQAYPEYEDLPLSGGGVTSHEALTGLQGGTSGEHYHLTEAEKEKVSSYPVYEELTGGINHDELGGLKGGNAEGYYHLTGEELTKLQELSGGGTSNHEELSNLLGGEAAGHFHLTGSQLTNLQKLIALFFPDGVTQPVIPEGITIYDPYGNLPSGTPPAWTAKSFPSGYTASDKVHKMYAGNWPVTNFGNGVCALMINGSKTYLMFSNDLETWKNTSIETLSTTNILTVGAGQFFYRDYNYLGGDDNLRAVVYLPNHAHGSETVTTTKPYIYYAYADGYSSYKIAASSKTLNAVCYLPLLKILIICDVHNAYIKPFNEVLSTTSTQRKSLIGARVNPGCAAWSTTQQVFCVSGPDGTATSSDGETWNVHSTAPKDLIDLEYRENLGCFIARGETTKLFYASGDGETWQPVNQTPIPLETVAAVDYNPENEWYCAVGGTGKYAYFSKDLEHWIPTTISNSDVTAGSVIYMPSTGLYVLMPTSGNYYYTFNPSNWSDDD